MYDDRDARIHYTGSDWVRDTSGAQFWYQGTNTRVSSLNRCVSFVIDGDGFALWGWHAPGSGSFAAHVNGSFVAHLSQYAPVNAQWSRNTVTGLGAGQHHIVLVTTSTEVNAVDAIEVFPHIDPTPAAHVQAEITLEVDVGSVEIATPVHRVSWLLNEGGANEQAVSFDYLATGESVIITVLLLMLLLVGLIKLVLKLSKGSAST